MKKRLSILLVIVMALMLAAGCSSSKSSDSEEEGGLVGVCMQNMSSSISELQSEALKEKFEAQGYEVQVVSADDSVSSQTQQIKNFILMGAKMIVVLPCEIETLEETLLEAKEAGIKVVISGGTGSISEDAYDAVCSDDEYMIGMYVAAIAKAWVEENMDPDGDWDVAFLSSTISADAKSRCAGEQQIIEPYLKNEDGEYVDLLGQVVDESKKIDNPVYCQMIADRVENLADATTEMDISGDNRSVVAGVLTDNDKVRVLIGYNSLVSTAGSQYIMDTYPEEEQKEFAFFSAGVMGDEYEYLIGSVSDEAGTQSVFRGACQFGGGDAAATLANLADAVMNGEAGVDYGKTNPNSIGLFYPIAAELNDGVAALVCFDTPSHIAVFTYEEVLSQDNLMTYWDAKNGYNENMQEEESGDAAEGAAAAGTPTVEGAAAYTYESEGPMGTETLQFDLLDDGTCRFSLPGNTMITDAYAGHYTTDGTTVTITGLSNVDASSEYKIPGLWSFINSETGDCTITIDEETGTFTPVE